MIRLKVMFVLATLVAGFTGVRAQGEIAPNGQIRCGTVKADAHLRNRHPEIGTQDDFERWMRTEIARQQASPNQKVSATRVIPVVVHVIYSNAAENISDNQIFSQIDILNEDFERTNPDTINTPAAFRPFAADTDVEFCLASLDPNNNPTNGINRISRAGSPFTSNDFENTIKPATIWDPNNYMNIWVANLSGGLLGYAQFPEAATLPGIGTGNGGANTDGVVAAHTSVGRPPDNPFGGVYNRGRTLTHEVGHWLGLRHIWGDGGCTVDDFCADTPTSDGSNFGCPTTHVSCSTTDMVQNYMDYTDDLCMNIFTFDQKSRIDVVLGGSPRRASLLNSTVCNVSPEIYFDTGTTIATEATLSGTNGCRGFQDIDLVVRIGGPPTGNATVTLTVGAGNLVQGVDYDIIVGAVVFPGGATAPQTFSIRLYDDGAVETVETIIFGFTISGTTDAFPGAQTTHTLTLNDNDLPPALAGSGTLFSEDFEGGVVGWTLQNMGGGNQWVTSGTGVALGGTRSAYISRNGTGNTYNRNNTSASRLRSPAINATGQSGMILNFSFRSAGEQAAAVNYDYGKLSYSFDGTNFINIAGTAANSPFVLQATSTAYSVAIPAALDNTTFFLGFEWENDNNSGTNPPFAIDDIVLIGNSPIAVETDLNSTQDEYLGPFSTVYWYDQTSGEVMLQIDNPTAHDYGCTSVTVDRQGVGAALYMDASVAYALTDKTYLVTPTNNNSSGQYTARLYYTAAEIAGWETATGQARSNILVAKTGGSVSNITPATPQGNGPTNFYGLNPVRGAYATSDFFVEGEFSTGFSGFGAGLENITLVPVEFSDIFAEWQGTNAAIHWETGEMSNLLHFEIERMLDNRGFVAVGQLQPAASEMGGGAFAFLDRTIGEAFFQDVYYRIRAVDTDGAFGYSEIRRLAPEGALQVNMLPNPFTDVLELRVQLPEPGPIVVEVYNALGQAIVAREMLGAHGSNRLSFTDQKLYARGIYFVKVRAAGAETVLRAVRQ